jgi:AcrR family transcriptional regulator
VIYIDNLIDDKKTNIFQAALKVFSQYGFDKASTVEIASFAGVSKGLVFHYYKNKHNLFMEVYKESLNIASKEIYEKINYQEPDLLDRMYQSIFSKMMLIGKYPDIFDFLKIAYFEENEKIKYEIQNINSELLKDSFTKIFTGIDYSLFRNDIDPNLAISTITMALEKWSDNYIREKLKMDILNIDLDDLTNNLKPYFEFYKKSFYKQEVL